MPYCWQAAVAGNLWQAQVDGLCVCAQQCSLCSQLLPKRVWVYFNCVKSLHCAARTALRLFTDISWGCATICGITCIAQTLATFIPFACQYKIGVTHYQAWLRADAPSPPSPPHQQCFLYCMCVRHILDWAQNCFGACSWVPALPEPTLMTHKSWSQQTNCIFATEAHQVAG